MDRREPATGGGGCRPPTRGARTRAGGGGRGGSGRRWECVERIRALHGPLWKFLDANRGPSNSHGMVGPFKRLRSHGDHVMLASWNASATVKQWMPKLINTGLRTWLASSAVLVNQIQSYCTYKEV
ncbi:hypothetical protein EVAR_24286_1 [Eumeta japonica]|uniref:Uncharacterized protein n=1 Tax=Eumeta variegata TaxID=151549 RepID=A0A4C1VGL9_EUMVA|nr:hypothetical protein EVAR_24286_1 [Eumeta japonica]